MVYPAFEYSLLIYLSLDILTSAVQYKKGLVSKTFWTISKILFPIQFLLCAWFRMIFVIVAYENVQGHTAGFLGLQVALMIVAILNVYQILETKVHYSWLGGYRGTRLAASIYLALNMTVSSIKFYLVCLHITNDPTLLPNGTNSL